MVSRTLVFSAVAACASACASDGAPEPEATADTPGAFIAADFGEEELRLYRTLDYFDLENRRILFVSLYRPKPQTFEEARELARDHALPVGVEFDYLGLADLRDVPHEIVWFRTLTAEERDRVP